MTTSDTNDVVRRVGASIIAVQVAITVFLRIDAVSSVLLPMLLVAGLVSGYYALGPTLRATAL